MQSLRSKFEAIEARIASTSYLHTAPRQPRFQRCFPKANCRQSAHLSTKSPFLTKNNSIDTDGETQILYRDGPGAPLKNNRRRNKLQDSKARMQTNLTALPSRREDLIMRTKLGDNPIDPRYYEMHEYSNVLLKEIGWFRSALRTGNPHAVIASLLAMTTPFGFHGTTSVLSALPVPTFSEVLRCLNPDHFVLRYKQLHMELSPISLSKLGLADAENEEYYTFLTMFIGTIRQILRTREKWHPLGLSDYKYLLRCAEAAGDHKAATDIWWSLNRAALRSKDLRRDFDSVVIEPDAECYNLYLGALCWNDIMKPHQRNRLRVIPRNQIPRLWASRPLNLDGHSMGDTTGLKKEASTLFRQMVDAGVAGNEQTFCLMMVALAREGDLAGVASVLKRVWKIDVQSLMDQNETEPLPMVIYSRDSPFYPSETLLLTIAHVYGINNTIPTALRLVDHISRQFSIQISSSVWRELLQWAFVLSHPRAGKTASDVKLGIEEGSSEVGKLPQEAVANLWITMTSEPYNVKPTMQMYNWLIVSLYYRKRWGEMQHYMNNARNIAMKDIKEVILRRKLFIASRDERGSDQIMDLRLRDLAYASLRVSINRLYMKKWTRLLMRHASRDLKYNWLWAPQAIPKLVEVWQYFLPHRISYATRSGHVDMKIWNPRGSNSRRRVRWRQRAAEAKLRPANGHRRIKMYTGKLFKMSAKVKGKEKGISRLPLNCDKHSTAAKVQN